MNEAPAGHSTIGPSHLVNQQHPKSRPYESGIQMVTVTLTIANAVEIFFRWKDQHGKKTDLETKEKTY